MNYNYYQGMANQYGRNYGMQGYSQPQFQTNYQQPSQTMGSQQNIQYEPQGQIAIFYASLKEAEGQIVYPNNKVIFIDKDKGMIYVKSTNNDGQSFMQHYKEVKIGQDGEPIIDKEDKIDYSIFATKEQLSGYASIGQYNDLLKEIEQLKRQLGGKNNNGARS